MQLATGKRREEVQLVTVLQSAVAIFGKWTALPIEHERVAQMGRMVECLADRQPRDFDQPAKGSADRQAYVGINIFPVVADTTANHDPNLDLRTAQFIEDSHDDSMLLCLAGRETYRSRRAPLRSGSRVRPLRVDVENWLFLPFLGRLRRLRRFFRRGLFGG